ncbi:uncharacterized protein RCO7_12005 [Rhynchosporium graminicola]|uniref:Uncharacterized protein n=1 Tax=Rhynchosporium graminicola TaxID=2792576 RepID=A0A1E1JQN4_9HELO|nr:uncharacterized protein RCO7_12005 [Rhynchosporium commune]
MKHLFILLACIAATQAASHVVCQAFFGASIGDVEWAVVHRRKELALGEKGFWGGRRMICNGKEVLSLCRSDPYEDQHSTVLKQRTSSVWEHPLHTPYTTGTTGVNREPTSGRGINIIEDI